MVSNTDIDINEKMPIAPNDDYNIDIFYYISDYISYICSKICLQSYSGNLT